MAFKTSVNTAPHFAEKGELGETVELRLELKLLADVGLAGFPNAGKSTLLSHISAARPKIGDYPFTTLTPNLGVVQYHKRSFAVADIPGLIEGAHEGRGLGDEFLRHIERTRVIVHLVDVTGFDGKTAYQNYVALNKELAAYSPVLAKKLQIVAANKMDLTGSDKLLAAFKKKLKKVTVVPVSAATGKGLKELLNAVVKILDKTPETPAFTAPSTHINIETDFAVKRENDAFRVTGKKVERLIQMTNFSQDEGVARLQKVLKRMGVEKALADIGAEPGDPILLGPHEFTFRPE
jgi:GTP-binding protein